MEELLEAIKDDRIAMVKKLLGKKEINLSQIVYFGDEYELEEPEETNILFYSIRTYASIEIIKLLIEYGVDIFQTTKEGVGAIDIAIKFKREDVVQLCVDLGVDINTSKRKSKITPIILASCFNNISMVELLIRNGANINGIDNSKMSAKDYAKKLGQNKMLDFLDSIGAEFNLYR
ncbi:MAG: ankyrin repeat domain-containing protein [Sulfurovum sp.]|nr:MAG: ankyrin repeat domain-containing protein [Sulfurovum sp.]